MSVAAVVGCRRDAPRRGSVRSQQERADQCAGDPGRLQQAESLPEHQLGQQDADDGVQTPQHAHHGQRASEEGLRESDVPGGGQQPGAEHPGQVAAPFAGVVTLQVKEGDTVESGQPVATIEAMKMEASITAPTAGTVERLAISTVQQVEGSDLLLVLR